MKTQEVHSIGLLRLSFLCSLFAESTLRILHLHKNNGIKPFILAQEVTFQYFIYTTLCVLSHSLRHHTLNIN